MKTIAAINDDCGFTSRNDRDRLRFKFDENKNGDVVSVSVRLANENGKVSLEDIWEVSHAVGEPLPEAGFAKDALGLNPEAVKAKAVEIYNAKILDTKKSYHVLKIDKMEGALKYALKDGRKNAAVDVQTDKVVNANKARKQRKVVVVGEINGEQPPLRGTSNQNKDKSNKSHTKSRSKKH